MTTPPPELEIIAGAQTHAGPELPPLPGFFASDFAPLVHAAARACLGDPATEHLLEAAEGPVGIVLGSTRFDTASLELSVEHIDQGRVSPILFYQVVPTAVLGHLARDYRLTGPVSCVAVTGDARPQVLELARLLLADRSAESVLALTVELDPDPARSFARADLVRPRPGPTPGRPS